jgi:peptidoglycan/LPS O-acetylase OafA/YrhL
MSTVAESGPRPVAGRLLPIDRLRAFLTVLVVTHHAVLAYHPYAPKPPDSLAPGVMAWAAFPVVDGARWPGIDALVAFNDSFFMALMFLLAGLFVPSGIARRGPAGYLRERGLRLGLPFLFAAGLLAPLAYAATYEQVSAAPSFAGFATQWLALGVWPAGPAWFLWVLLAFGAVAVALTALAPQWAQRWARVLFGDGTRPWRALFGLLAASLVAYVPIAMWIDPLSWSSFGPFFVQTARVPLYLLYFLAGAALATQRAVLHGLLDPEGRLARRWLLWTHLAPVAFVALIVVFLVLLSVLQKGGDVSALKLACNALFVLSCAVTSLAFLAVFLRKARRPQRLWDSLAGNAFGIYLLHYPIVAWLQYALLPAPWPGYAKGSFVILAGVVLSWLLSAALRRIAGVERVIGNGAAAR